MEHGPWTARYFAASLYVQEWAYLPSAGDWAARSLTLSAPPLFGGKSGFLRAPTYAVSPPSTREAADKNPEVAARLTSRVTNPEEDMTNRRRRRTPRRRSRSNFTETPSRTCPEEAPSPPRGRQRESEPHGRESADTPRPPDYLPPPNSPEASLIPPRGRQSAPQPRRKFRDSHQRRVRFLLLTPYRRRGPRCGSTTGTENGKTAAQ